MCVPFCHMSLLANDINVVLSDDLSIILLKKGAFLIRFWLPASVSTGNDWANVLGMFLLYTII